MEDLDEVEIAEFKDTFSLYDEDGNGTISITDLGHCMRSHGHSLSMDGGARRGAGVQPHIAGRRLS